MPRDLRALSTTTGSPSFDRRGLLRLLHLLWPQNEPGFRLRLTITIALLAAAALLNALVPLLFAAAIDHLSVNRAALAAPLAILAGYVLLQWLARVLNESRWALYGPIDQRLQRRLALRAVEHLHGLSLRFHLGRRTGEISRILDNGLKGLREVPVRRDLSDSAVRGRDRVRGHGPVVAGRSGVRRHPARHADRLWHGGDRVGVAARAPAPGGRARRTARRSTACSTTRPSSISTASS